MNNRIQFANQDSKEIWSYKLNESRNLSIKLKREALLRGITNSRLIRQGELDEQSSLILSGNGFRFEQLKNNWILISNSDKEIEEVKEYFQTENYQELEKIVGWPSCCIENLLHADKNRLSEIELLCEHSVKKNSRTITKNRAIPRETTRLDNRNYLLNPFYLSWGIGLIDYIPCSYECEKSIKVSHKLKEIAKQINPEQINYLEELLTMPVEWSSLKGIAEIKTPVFKFMESVQYRFPECCIQKEGENYPEEAPSGIYFPWKIKGVNFCDS